MKDMDLNYRIPISADKARRLRAQLEMDTWYLRTQGFMDYSLYLGVHKRAFVVDFGQVREATGENMWPRNLTPRQAHSVVKACEERRVSRSSLGSITAREGEAERVARLSVGEVHKRGSVGEVHKRGSMPELYAPAAAPPPPPGGTEPEPLGSGPDERVAASPSRRQRGQAASVRVGLQLGEHEAPQTDVPFFMQEWGGVGASFIEGPAVFYIGIIDTLQLYSVRKKLEHFLKVTVRGFAANEISCVGPTEYQRRMMTKIEDIIEVRTNIDPLRSSNVSVQSDESDFNTDELVHSWGRPREGRGSHPLMSPDAAGVGDTGTRYIDRSVTFLDYVSIHPPPLHDRRTRMQY